MKYYGDDERENKTIKLGEERVLNSLLAKSHRHTGELREPYNTQVVSSGRLSMMYTR